MFGARVIYDMLFFFVVIIIVLNLIFGVIIDTFADLRSEKQQKEEILKNTCGLDRSQFDNKAVSFEDHIRHPAQHVALFLFYRPRSREGSYGIHRTRKLRLRHGQSKFSNSLKKFLSLILIS
jgi:hypothetical protein